MKKMMLFLLSACMMLSLVACGGSKIADGTYSAEISDASAEANHGWKDFLTITYKDGEMVDVQFDAKDADGNLKTESTNPENYPMDPQPSVWMPQLEENIKATSNPDKVAAVAGATTGSNHAKELYRAVLEKAKAGDTSVAVIDVEG
ncbi:MAG TPA: hypothetical protein H9896_01040 [Candidatus Pygmaiobacter gallistercoris]|nr:hypothetical protein [Candidatus Pygmaiobacter gallistercoris]